MDVEPNAEMAITGLVRGGDVHMRRYDDDASVPLPWADNIAFNCWRRKRSRALSVHNVHAARKAVVARVSPHLNRAPTVGSLPALTPTIALTTESHALRR